MPVFGNIVVIKRNGTDGINFPLTASSCLFGRKTECDIRIQLPQVSKEHCKIDINENKEAILTNLSAVNPTKLNGDCFQQPVPLKHGDVLTVIDRSFRFEYPLQSTPRKRRSRSPKDETLQVLHVQQVAEVELLHKQPPGSKSLHASDNAEREEKNADENKQSTEKNISKTFPIQLQTPKSSYKIRQSLKKQAEMSPFSKLYEKLKHEIKVKKPLQQENVSHRAAKEGGENVLLCPSARISSSSCVYDLGSLTKEKETGRSENTEECQIQVKQDVITLEFNQISVVGSVTKKSFTSSPQTSFSMEMWRDTGTVSDLQDHKELSTPGKSKGVEVITKPSKESDGNASCPREICPIVLLDYATERHSPAKSIDKSTQTTRPTDGSEADVLSTATSRRKSPRSREAGGMTLVNADTPTSRRRVSLKRKALSEVLAEAPKEGPVSRNDGLEQLPLAESKGLKERRNSKQATPGKPGKEAALKEICDQANFVNSKEGRSEMRSNSKSPRRSKRQSKELSNKSVQSETWASEELTAEVASPAGQKSGSGKKRGRLRTSGELTEKASGTNTTQEHHEKTANRKGSGTKEELPTKECHQKQAPEDASATRPCRLSSGRKSSGNATALKDSETPVSEMNISGLVAGEESGKQKRILPKRKSDGVLLQPLGKRKRVSFGGQLSPELFDKSLPPNSPLKKGAVPARLSLPFGDSPRAVLKKAQGLKHFAVQKEKMSPKHLQAQKSSAASSPASPKATPSKFTLSSPAPYRRGRFSVSGVVTSVPIAEEKDIVAEDMDTKEKSGARVQTPKSSHVNQDKTCLTATSDQLTRSAQLALKVTPTKRRSGAVAVFNAKRRSGASSANLLVAKSWAEVVKLGVARPQSKTVKKGVRKGRARKKTTQSPKTPERKVKGHFSTGHAKSPATIVVGRAYSTTVKTTGQVPKVVKNPLLKLNVNMDESFTGMTEMFQTPENKNGKTLPLATVEKIDFTPTVTAEEISELHTPEETGEMMVSPLNSSGASEQKHDSPGICCIMREEESLNSIFDAISSKTPEERKSMLEENIIVDTLSIIPEKQASQVKSRSKRRASRQKSEPTGVVSGIKELFRTPKRRSEPVEALSGIKQLVKTPKQKSEPVEALSGIKRLMRTPKQKMEPVEALSSIKQLVKTPKQKSEPVEALSGIKRLMRAPKQKMEPVEALSSIKHLMKTPKQKSEPVETLSGIKRLLRTPKQKTEPVEVLSGIRQLLRTPKREPVEVLSGIKQLMRTPQQEFEPVTDEIAFKKLLKTPVQKREAVKDGAGVNSIKKTPKLKYQPVEDMIGISRIFKTPKEKVEPIQSMFGISRLMKTPREKSQPVDDFVGLQSLMAEPRQKRSSFEVDYAGVTEMFDVPVEMEVRSASVTDAKQEDPAPPCPNSSQKYDPPVLEVKENISQVEDSQQQESTSEDQSTQRPKRGRPLKTAHPASAKRCEKDLNSKELQGLEKKSTQEEMGEITTAASAVKNKGRGQRTNRCVQEVVLKQPDQEKVETVSSVEPRGATQRPGRGKRKELKELKHPSENRESCGKDSSVLREELANMKQTLQECGIDDIVETEDEPTIKTVSVSSSIQNENQLQTGLEKPDNKSNKGGVEDSEEMLLSPGRRTRGVKKVEKTEPLTPPKRGRRVRNDQAKQPSSEDLDETTRKLRKDPPAKVIQRDEQTFAKDTETATAEESENGTKCEIKVTEKRVKSLRSARKHSAEVKAEVCGVALENAENIQKTEETSTEIQSHIRNETEVPQGDETENAQENATEASQRLKAESPSGETNTMPVTALNLEANRTRNKRGRKDSLETKTDDFAKDVNNVELITPQIKSQTETDKSCLADSLGSVCVKDTDRVTQDQNSPAANSDSLAAGRQRRTRNEQGIIKAEQTETLPEKQAQTNRMACRRGRGRKVKFEPEEASSKAAAGKRSLQEDDKAITSKEGQHETSETLQVRRSRRKQVDSVPQIACPTSIEKQPLIADQSEDEAFVKEQVSALEATPSSTEDSLPRRGRRREVAAASQTSRSLSTRTRRGLLEADDKTTTVREDQNSALGNKTMQAKANASARDKGKEIDLAAEEKSSSSLGRKHGLAETGDKEEGTNEEQNMPLETVSCAKEKPLGRGRRKEAAQASLTTNYISLRGKRGLPASNGGKAAPKEDQNVPSETSDSSVKENQLRKGRRKEIALLLEVTSSSTQGKGGLSKERGRKNNCREEKKLILENSTSQEKMDLSRGNLKQTSTSRAVSPPSLQGLPEDGKNETPEEQQRLPLEATPSAKENPSRAGRKKTISSKSAETSSALLREKPALPKGRGQKRILEVEELSLETNSSQEKTMQLRNKRKKVEFTSEAAISTSPSTNCNLPENEGTSETRDVSLTATGSGKTNQSGEGKEATPVQQATSASRRRKCQLPADDFTSKKLKSESNENGSLRRGKRTKTREELGEEDVRAAQAAGGTDRKTRSSARTRK